MTDLVDAMHEAMERVAEHRRGCARCGRFAVPGLTDCAEGLQLIGASRRAMVAVHGEAGIMDLQDVFA